MQTRPRRFAPLGRETRGYLCKGTDDSLDAVRIETEESWVIETFESVTSKKYRTTAAAQKAADERLRQLERQGYSQEHPAIGMLLPQLVRFPCTGELVNVCLTFNVDDVSEEELQSLASMAEWQAEVCSQMELAGYGHYLQIVESIAPDPSWFPVIKRPTDIWKHCSVCHIRPYKRNVIIVYATCSWEEDGLEWCIRRGELISLGNAAFWPVTEEKRGYFDEPVRKSTQALIAQIPKRIKLIKGWKQQPRR
jgi:hypothetical protein